MTLRSSNTQQNIITETSLIKDKDLTIRRANEVVNKKIDLTEVGDSRNYPPQKLEQPDRGSPTEDNN